MVLEAMLAITPSNPRGCRAAMDRAACLEGKLVAMVGVEARDKCKEAVPKCCWLGMRGMGQVSHRSPASAGFPVPTPAYPAFLPAFWTEEGGVPKP